jgi:hypothetical protein
MEESNRKAFAIALSELMAFYEAFPIQPETWWKALKKYSLEVVVAGFEAHITDPQEGKFPPKPAHIIGYIERLFPKRSGCYALYKPEPQNPSKRLPLTYEVTPEHFSHLMKRAMLFAEGKGTAEDKSDHLQDLIRMVKGIGTPLPYDKARRHLLTEPVDNPTQVGPQTCRHLELEPSD